MAKQTKEKNNAAAVQNKDGARANRRLAAGRPAQQNRRPEASTQNTQNNQRGAGRQQTGGKNTGEQRQQPGKNAGRAVTQAKGAQRPAAQSKTTQRPTAPAKGQPAARAQQAKGQTAAKAQRSKKQILPRSQLRERTKPTYMAPATGVPGAKRVADRGASVLPAAAAGAAVQRRQDTGLPLRIIPLGGLGEVGKNMTLYECGGDMFIVDCGSLFPDAEMLGVDLVIPDYAYALQNAARIKGIVITHGHEDHTGALPYFLKQCKVPVYGTRLTLGLIENKLREHGLLSEVELRLITPGQRFRLGSFEIDPLRVNHSIPDAIALAINTPVGTVIQTGDFKIDHTPVTDKPIDLAAFAAYGQKGVLALLSDSTNAERPGHSNSERTVGRSFERLFRNAENKRIIIATFSSNIQRIQQIFDMAQKSGRKVAVSGRSMINNIDMALELGYLHAPATLLIDIENINSYPPEKLVVVTTGSQGEPLSALSRMSDGVHRNVQIGVGDFVIFSSKPIPGNEKMVDRVVNSLMKQGADVIYESMYDVHTSGHACQEEQKLMISLVKPRYFIPVHGEFKQLKKHADLAHGLGMSHEHIHIPDIGQVIALRQSGLTLEAGVPAGQMLVDGFGIGDVGSVILRDRQHLAEDGLVVLTATVRAATGELLCAPEIVSRGFVYMKEHEALIQDAVKCTRDMISHCWDTGVRDWGAVKNRVRDAVSQLLYRRTGRSPMVLPIIMTV